MRENKQKLIALMGALISTLGIVRISGAAGSCWLLILVIISLVSCYSVISKYLQIKSDVSWWQAGWSLLFAWLFSLAIVLGYNLNATNAFNLTQLNTYVNWGLLIPISFVGTALIIHLLNRWQWQTNYPTRIGKLSPWFIYWLGTLICWLPVIIATFPGNWAYDAGVEIKYYQLYGGISPHHPVSHTLLLIWLVLDLGQHVLGNPQWGLLIYTLLQVMILAASYASVFTFLRRHHSPRWFLVVTYLLLVISPYNQLMAVSATKNVLFTAWLVWLVILLLDEDYYLTRYGTLKYGGLVALNAFLSIIFLNQFIYIFIVAMGTSLLINRHLRKLYLGVLVGVIAAMIVYTGPVYKLVGVQPSADDRFREMMSVPALQLASVASQHFDQFSKDEQQLIRRNIPKYQQYQQINQQGLADDYKVKLKATDKIELIRLWLKEGFKYPQEYLNAVGRSTIGYWYLLQRYPSSWTEKEFIEYSQNADYSKFKSWWYDVKPKNLPYYNGYRLFLTNWSQMKTNKVNKYAVTSLLLNLFNGFWVAILILFDMIIKKQKKSIIVILISLGMLGVNLLGPVVLYRYIYPIVSVLPLILGLVKLEGNSNGKV